MMNKQQKEVISATLEDEANVLKKLKDNYTIALADIKNNIKKLQSNPLTQSKAYQLDFQKQLEKQISGIIDKLQGDNFTSVAEYLNICYNQAFLGTMYDIHAQGIPLILPLNQKQVLKTVQKTGDDIKLSAKLGNSDSLKKQILSEMQRGFSTDMSYTDIARNISNCGEADFNRSMRIARTEGHRVQNEAKLDTYKSIKDKGADIVKQWDATLDGDTRKNHRKLDGQIRELEEDFEIDGKSAPCPGKFNDPAEDCNCRCALLQRARWALDENELKTLQERAEYFGLDKSDSFAEFKEKYLNAVEKSGESGIIKTDEDIVYKSFNTGEEVNEFFYYDDPNKKGLLQRKNSTYGKWKSNLTAVQQQAIDEYTTGGYAGLNQFLREFGDWDTLDKDMMLEFRDDMRSVISDFELKEPVKVYRYVSKNTFLTQNLEQLVGTDFIDKGFMSTSPTMKGIENAVITGKDIILEINVPAGKGRGAYLNELSPWKDIEYEFLLKDSTKCRITSFDNSGDKPILRMEVI